MARKLKRVLKQGPKLREQLGKHEKVRRCVGPSIGPCMLHKFTLDVVLASGGSNNPICYLLGRKKSTIYPMSDIFDFNKRVMLP